MKLLSSSLDSIVTLRWRNYTFDTGTANASKRLSRAAQAVAIDTVANGNRPTVTLATHRLNDGDFVTILGADKAQFNGLFKATVTDPGFFTITVPGAETLGDPAGASMKVRCMAQKAILFASAANVAVVTFGGDSGSDFFALAAGQSYLLEAPHGAKFDIDDLYVISTSANQSVKVFFI